MTTHPPLEDYFRALAEVDSARATAIVLGLLDDGTPMRSITEQVLVPAQVRVGEHWQRGQWSVADEHAATAVTETALAALTRAAARPIRGDRHIVIACAEGEWHTLPARAAAGCATAGGVRITTMGPSMPAEHLGRRLAAGDVDLLALSCTMPTNLIGAARCVQAAHDQGVPVLTGGRAFGRGAGRSEAIGADAHASSPQALIGPIPEMAGRASDIPLEALLLDAVEPGAVCLAHERLVAAYPRHVGMTGDAQALSREDLRSMARFTGAALVVKSPGLLDDFLSWLAGLLSPDLSIPVLTAGAHLLADVLEPDAPTGADLLRTRADRLKQSVLRQDN